MVKGVRGRGKGTRNKIKSEKEREVKLKMRRERMRWERFEGKRLDAEMENADRERLAALKKFEEEKLKGGEENERENEREEKASEAEEGCEERLLNQHKCGCVREPAHQFCRVHGEY